MARAGAACCCLLLLLAGHAFAVPIQYLPDIPGYIPVYIRLGDQPLEEINPVLAEAFHEPSGVGKISREVRLDEPKTEGPKDESVDSSEKLAVTLPNTTEAPKKIVKESFVMKIPRKMSRQTREQKLNK